MTKELQPTYGNFTLRGQVVWKNRKNSFREDVSGNGFLYRAVQFGIKTADKNIVQVELFQTKFETVKLQNIQTKALDEDVKYGEHEGELPEGYKLFMPINLGIEQDENGENIKVKKIPYDAAKYIDENLNDGDTVFMFGSPKFSEFTDKEGNKTPKIVFEPRGIYKSSVDFNDEEFKGEAVFDQEIVIVKSDKKDNKLVIQAYIITDKKGNFVPHTFYIDIDKYKDFALNVRKLKFGTKLKVKGLIHHTVEEKEVETASGWGEEPTSNSTITNVTRELEITKAEKPQKGDLGHYGQEDFVKKEKKSDEDNEDPFKNGGDNNDSDWGDDPNSNSEDPFEDGF